MKIMKRTRKSKANKQPQSVRNWAEDALEIAIEIAPLDSEVLKALRLVCKRTKMAADARVTEFTLSFDEQDSEAVQRSGLLDNILGLHIDFEFTLYGNRFSAEQLLSRALDLLELAVDVCSHSVEILDVAIFASQEIIVSCARVLGNSKWESLEALWMNKDCPMPGFLSGILARPSNLSALERLSCQDPGVSDIRALRNSNIIGNLDVLSIHWFSTPTSYNTNTSFALIDAVHGLLQKATNLTGLHLCSSTFEFFTRETPLLPKLNSLGLEAPERSIAHIGEVDLSPALELPWPLVETLLIEGAYVKGADLVRILEAEDTLPVLKDLEFQNSYFGEGEGEDDGNGNGISCVHRPHLGALSVLQCKNSHVLISNLAQLMKEDATLLSNVRSLRIDFGSEHIHFSHSLVALYKFLSCPSMAALEEVDILDALLGANGASVLHALANHCPNLKNLDVRYNSMGRPAVALFAGYGHMGAWPHLQKLCISSQESDHKMGDLYYLYDPNNDAEYPDPDDNESIESINAFHSCLPASEVQETLQHFWPGLECT